MNLKKSSFSIEINRCNAGCLVVYLICGYLIPFYRSACRKKTNEPKVIETYILTNGVHTDLVVPVKMMKWIGERTSF